MVVAYLIEHRYIDCLVSTGANLYHDLHETRGRHHYLGSAHANDAALADDRIDRVYDTYASEEEFCDNDVWIGDFVASLEERPYTSREFLNRLGGHLWTETGQNGILTAAYRAGVPIFCPAIADSSIGMGLSQGRHKKPGSGYIDIIGDIIESANLVIRRPRTASVVLGGGTPKNFINQASVQAEFFSPAVGGHKYALQIVTDVPAFRRSLRLDARRSPELGQARDRCRAGDRARRRHDRLADSGHGAGSQLRRSRQKAHASEYRPQRAANAHRRQAHLA